MTNYAKITALVFKVFLIGLDGEESQDRLAIKTKKQLLSLLTAYKFMCSSPHSPAHKWPCFVCCLFRSLCWPQFAITIMMK